MADAIRHVSQHRLNGAELQVIADAAKGIEDLVEVEKKVVRLFLLQGGWPHRRVTLFVFENLQPVIERLRRAAQVSDAIAQQLERKPMVHVYNMGDLRDSSVFINRRLLSRLGLWDDPLALEGLLAHEHAHPMAENDATRAARSLKFRLKTLDAEGAAAAAPSASQAIAASFDLLVHELCLHAPHEVFSNELAIRAGFGPALKHLNLIGLSEAHAGMAERTGLAEGLRAQAAGGMLSSAEAALLLLAASMEAHVRLALETAAFMRAGRSDDAAEIGRRAETEVFRHVDPEVGACYRAFLLRYLDLTPEMDRDAVRAWATAAVAPLIDAFGRRGARFDAEFYDEGEGS